MKTTTLELECVGNAGNGYINAQCLVLWFEVLVNEDQKKVRCISHYLTMKDYRRKDRINYCRFDVPEGVICCYIRSVQTKPSKQESKWFRIDNAQVAILGDVVGGTCSFVKMFLQKYKHYDYEMS